MATNDKARSIAGEKLGMPLVDDLPPYRRQPSRLPSSRQLSCLGMDSSGASQLNVADILAVAPPGTSTGSHNPDGSVRHLRSEEGRVCLLSDLGVFVLTIQ